MKITKIILILSAIAVITSCVAAPKEESKTARTRAAQDRINASKSGADVITKELDN